MRGLDGDRQPVPGDERVDLVGAAHRAVRARRQRRPHLLRDPPGGHLVAERLDGGRWRPDPGQPGVDDRPREGRVLGQEPVPGVDRIGPRVRGPLEDLLDVEVAVGGGLPLQRVGLVGHGDVQCVQVLLGIHGNAGQAGVPARPHDADGYLAAVRDEHLAHVNPFRPAEESRAKALMSAGRSRRQASPSLPGLR